MRYIFFSRKKILGGGEKCLIQLKERLLLEGHTVITVSGSSMGSFCIGRWSYSIGFLIDLLINNLALHIYILIDRIFFRSFYLIQDPWPPTLFPIKNAYFWFHTENCFGLFLLKSRWKIFRAIGRFNLNLISSRFSSVLFNSLFIKKTLGEIGLVGQVAYPIVNKIVAKPGSLLGCDGKSLKFGFVNCVQAKGAEYVVRLAQINPDHQFLVVKGANPEKVILEKFDELKNVQVVPWFRDIEDLFKEIDILLMPSIWDEPFGMLQLEAQLHGIHVLSSGKGGLREADIGRVSFYNFEECIKLEKMLEPIWNIIERPIDHNRVQHLESWSIRERFSQNK